MPTTVDELRAALAALNSQLPAAAAVAIAIGEKLYDATGALMLSAAGEVRIVRHPAFSRRLALSQLLAVLDAAARIGGSAWRVTLVRNARDLDLGFYSLDFVSSDGSALFCHAELEDAVSLS